MIPFFVFEPNNLYNYSVLSANRENQINNVGIVLLNDLGLIFLGERVSGGWGMPQGGCDPGESIEETARRELYEETGLRNIAELIVLDKTFSYLTPSGERKIQKWIVSRWVGEEEVNLALGPYQEFRNWKWANKEEVLDKCVWFKKEIYREVLDQPAIQSAEDQA